MIDEARGAFGAVATAIASIPLLGATPTTLAVEQRDEDQGEQRGAAEKLHRYAAEMPSRCSANA